MRTLAPIRVRHCGPDDRCEGTTPHLIWVCRFCAADRYAPSLAEALSFALKHLRDRHPWPWTTTQSDTHGGTK